MAEAEAPALIEMSPAVGRAMYRAMNEEATKAELASVSDISADAVAVSPFAVDSIHDPGESDLAKSYHDLRQLAPMILAHQGKGAGKSAAVPVLVTDRRIRVQEIQK